MARHTCFAIDPTSGCWIPELCPSSHGYVVTLVDGRTQYLHRLNYEATHGPVPDGLQLDHLCRNRACSNPAHLEPVTRRENILRGTSPAATHAQQTHCINGHEFTPENTYNPPGRQRRQCKVCARRRDAEWRERRRG